MAVFEREKATQLIVLGRGMPDGAPSRQTCENAIAAASYYHENDGEISTVVFSGGRSHFAYGREPDGMTEAEVMRDLAVQAALPAEKTLVEGRSSSTLENFIFSAELLELNGLTGVVTHRRMMRRALFIAQNILGNVQPVYSEDYCAQPEEAGLIGSLVEKMAFFKDRAALTGVRQGDVEKAQARNDLVVKIESVTDIPVRRVATMLSSYK